MGTVKGQTHQSVVKEESYSHTIYSEVPRLSNSYRAQIRGEVNSNNNKSWTIPSRIMHKIIQKHQLKR